MASTARPATASFTVGNGDFNYDGVINGDDYTLIDNAFNTQGSTTFAVDSVGPAEMIAADTARTSIPEPGSLTAYDDWCRQSAGQATARRAWPGIQRLRVRAQERGHIGQLPWPATASDY